MSQILKYRVIIDNEVKRNLDNFKKTVSEILNDPRSWKVDFILVNNNQKADFDIILTKPKKIREICNFSGLSCTDRNVNTIYINSHRWCRGAIKSKLSLKDYRIYLINHEVGHILGMSHATPVKGRKTPVMNQHTNGLKGGIANVWPLPSEQRLIGLSVRTGVNPNLNLVNKLYS